MRKLFTNAGHGRWSVGILALACTCLSLTGTPVAAAETMAPAGALMGPALNVTDVARSLRFYVEGLGMRVGIEMGRPERHETVLTFDGNPRSGVVVLMTDRTVPVQPPVSHSHGFDRVILRINDLAAVSARLKANGFTPGEIRDSFSSAKSRVMMVKDPDGYTLELVQVAEGGAAK